MILIGICQSRHIPQNRFSVRVALGFIVPMRRRMTYAWLLEPVSVMLYHYCSYQSVFIPCHIFIFILVELLMFQVGLFRRSIICHSRRQTYPASLYTPTTLPHLDLSTSICSYARLARNASLGLSSLDCSPLPSDEQLQRGTQACLLLPA